jgi:LEA14-like dessication related protein
VSRIPVLAVLGLLATSCAHLQEVASSILSRPKMTVQNVEITGVSLTGIAANVVCEVENPNAFQLSLGSFDYQLSLDQHPLVSGKASQGFNVPAQGKGTVSFPVEFRFTELGQGLLALFQKEQVGYGVKATMGFNSPIGVVNVPLEHNGTFPVPRLPEVSLAGASIGDLGFSGVTMKVRIGLTNKNRFPIPLGNMSYRIVVEGTEIATGGVPAPNLAPEATGAIELPLRINFLGAGAAVAQVIRSGRANLKVSGGLEVTALHQTLPFEQERTFQLR